MRASFLLVILALRAGAQGAPVMVGVEGRSNQSAMVAAAGQFVALVFAASDANGADVYSAVSRDGGARFGPPVRVNSTPGDARVGGEQPPRVVLIEKQGAMPEIVVVWTTKSPDGTRLLTARSADGGRSFGASTMLPASNGAGNRGWESVAVDRSGRVFALWLDHRESARAREMSKGMAEMKHDPTAQAELSKLYFASLDDKTPLVITGGVCYCCKTSLATGADGSVYGVWRHVYPGSQRDIAFTVSRDGGRTFSSPVRVSEDHWQFDGCPENGPALAVDRDRRVHVAWPTPPDGKTGMPLALFYAMSRDGRSFTPRVRVPTNGAAHHVQMAATAGGAVLLAWDEIGAGGRKIRIAHARPDAAGKASFDAASPLDGEAGNYPVVAATNSGAVVAWTRTAASGNVIAVARIAR
jgi:hypothetical protein